MTNYTRGRALEYEIRDRLREDGYQAFRTAGSRGVADIVAIKPGQIVYCQAKKGGRISPAERTALFRAAADVGALPIVAARQPRQPIEWRRLTGTGPKEWQPWTPDQLGAAFRCREMVPQGG